MKVVGIIQARLGSKRLPYKMMLSLHGKPIIEWVVERTKRSKLLNKIILATSKNRENDILVNYLKYFNIEIFRGEEEDVVSRFYDVAKIEKADLIVRICADNPLICPEEIDRLINFYIKNPCDYAYNHIPKNNNYPDGLGAEITNFKILEEIYKNAKGEEREHIFNYIWNNPYKFSIKTFNAPEEIAYPMLKFDIDTFGDYYQLSSKKFDINISSSELIKLFKYNILYKLKEEKYNNWNEKKKRIEFYKNYPGFRERNIYFISVGVNIGKENNGKGKDFLRPVIVLKKLGKYNFIGVPLTTQEKDGEYYFKFSFIKGVDSIAMINQIRTFDAKRIVFYAGQIKRRDLRELQEKIKNNLLPQ